jgi:DNA-binding PadR family transcriptional regulator
MPLADLAAEQVFERTSLYRALEPLRREKLIAFSAGPGRSKLVALTPRGERRAAEAQPHWQAAQDVFLEEFGRSAWTGLARQLTELVEAVRLIPKTDDAHTNVSRRSLHGADVILASPARNLRNRRTSR